jgi:hypothetical protein
MSEDKNNKLNELEKGLKMLSKERKVVLPHHKTFELVDKMLEIVKSLKSSA